MAERTPSSRVTAVVVTWNSAGPAIRLMRSLEDAFAAGLRMVIVDNASADGSGETLRAFLEDWEHGRRVSLISSRTNLGFTGGVNLGTDDALGSEDPPDFIWLLNPDTTVSLATAAELVAVAEESGADIVAGRSEYFRSGAWPGSYWGKRASYWGFGGDSRS